MTPENKLSFDPTQYTLDDFRTFFSEATVLEIEWAFTQLVKEELAVASGLTDFSKQIDTVRDEISAFALTVAYYWGATNTVNTDSAALASELFTAFAGMIPNAFVWGDSVTPVDKSEFATQAGLLLMDAAANELKDNAPQLRNQFQEIRSKRS